jgi:hypothetical protein
MFVGMNATQPQAPKANLMVTHVLAELLERLERSTAPVGAGQYQLVVQRLQAQLLDAQPSYALQALLETHPAAAELYENVNYQHAGLCRSSLDASAAAEQQARAWIAQARQKPSGPVSAPEAGDSI